MLSSGYDIIFVDINQAETRCLFLILGKFLPFMMTRIKLYTILTMMVTLLNGCIVYCLDVPQGNEVTQDKVDKLQVGLTKSQVQYLLGAALLQDPFHANRWDYLYTEVRKGKIKQEKRFTVFFENDRLVRWEGDVLPASHLGKR